jgi:uncharacterized membrane protein
VNIKGALTGFAPVFAAFLGVTAGFLGAGFTPQLAAFWRLTAAFLGAADGLGSAF